LEKDETAKCFFSSNFGGKHKNRGKPVDVKQNVMLSDRRAQLHANMLLCYLY